MLNAYYQRLAMQNGYTSAISLFNCYRFKCLAFFHAE